MDDLEFIPRELCAWSQIVAHTPPRPGAPWHPLADHSLAVGDLAAEFAEDSFGGGGLARLAGYLHDAGKGTDEVQRRFRELGAGDAPSRRRSESRTSTEGAQLMAALAGQQRAPSALCGYLINQGHHAGLTTRTARTVCPTSCVRGETRL